MKNTLSIHKKRHNIHHKLYIIAPILCFIFIVISVFANAKEKEFQIKNNELSTEIETLKTTKDTLSKANKNLLESLLNLDALLGEISKVNN